MVALRIARIEQGLGRFHISVVVTIGKRWRGLFEWADYEEDDDMKYDNKNGTELSKKNLISRISNVEDEIRKLKRCNVVLCIFFLLIVFVMVGIVLGPESKNAEVDNFA
ncbi:hypothetical protein PIB30_000460 [Stylosanthes scabra]|uniref:Transmembrane protein n=1 Tax=Stylosanthes scabra TaxID=79078 RepID=A0ABU6V1J3_9FABA|nr:hypothetical protein [Stylosanthes scabra]